jgi:hypothetical protein
MEVKPNCNLSIVTKQGNSIFRTGFHEEKILQNAASVYASTFCSLQEKHRHGLINYVDTRAKFLHIKNLTCKGTLRQVFIRVYRLEIQSVMLVFLTQLCALLSHR